jgi:hypothetical protein
MDDTIHDDSKAPGCDHVIGWLHCRRSVYGAIVPAARPRLVRRSEMDDLVSAYRAKLAQGGASHRRTFALSDEMVFALAAYHFRYCPMCGAQIFPVVTQ